MGFGLDVFSGGGLLAYSSTDVTWNQVDLFLVGGNQTVSKSYPVLAGREFLAVQMLVDAPPINRRAVAHSISHSGTSVTVGGGSEQAYIMVLMR